jgi:hypothetical protein
MNAKRYHVKIDTWKLISSSSTELCSDDTPMRSGGQIVPTTFRVATTGSAVLGDCMRKSGSLHTGRSLKAARFITVTATHSTTTCTISNASLAKNTSPITRQGRSQSRLTCWPFFKQADPRRLVGIGQKRGVRGIVKWQGEFGQNGSHKNEPASSAEINTPHWQCSDWIDFAQIGASRNGVDSQALTMNSGSVFTAALPSLSTNTARNSVAIDPALNVIDAINRRTDCSRYAVAHFDLQKRLATARSF